MTQQPTPVDPTGLPPDEFSSPIEHGVPSGTRTPLFQASSAARYQRQAIIKQIEARTGRRLICYVSGSKCVINEDDTMPFVDLLHKCVINEDDTMPFVDLLHNVRPDESMELLLHTPGGNIDAAEKLIRMVRSKVGEAEFYIIVPEFAKSAGTLMVLGADRVVMSDMSELGPIDPQLPFPDSYGKVRWQTVQNYLDAYDEYTKTLTEQPGNVAAQVMLGKLDPAIVKLCQAVKERARQCAGDLLKRGMFREGGNWTLTVSELIDTKRWLSHSQMISWEDAQHPDTIGLVVEYLDQQSEEWQEYWRLYCLQRLAIGNHQKLYESEYASLVIDDPAV